MTVVLPFSQIKVEPPADELREMAALLLDLAAELAEFRPSPTTKQLAERAHSLVEKLGR